MKLRQTFRTPQYGYLLTGPWYSLDWQVDRMESARQGWTVVGSMEANYWFHVSPGGTEKGTLGNARRALSARAKRRGVECSFEYID